MDPFHRESGPAPPATAQESLKHLLAAHVAPLLKARGFRRQRNRWSKPAEVGWLIYEVQVSQWSNREQLSFTVNLGVWSAAVAAAIKDVAGAWNWKPRHMTQRPRGILSCRGLLIHQCQFLPHIQ